MPEELLYRTDVGPAFEEMGGKRVSEHVRRHALRNAGSLGREPNRVLKAAIQHMVPAFFPGAGVEHGFARRKQPLPLPALARPLKFVGNEIGVFFLVSGGPAKAILAVKLWPGATGTEKTPQNMGSQ